MWLNLRQWLKNRDFAWKFKLVVCLPIFLGLVSFDWITKGLVVGLMEQQESVNFIPHFLRFNYVINPGAAYGFNSGNPALAISLAALITIFLTIAFIFANDRKWLIALVFLLSGSWANLLARAWAPAIANGDNAGQKWGVVDFLQWDFSFLNSSNYIFNLADAWVTLGVVILVVIMILEGFQWFREQRHSRHEDIQKKSADAVEIESEN